MGFLFMNVLLAAVPSLALIAFFTRKGRLKPEFPGLVWKTYFFGFLAVIPAALAEYVLDGLAGGVAPSLRLNLIHAFLVAGLVEEGTKLLVVRVFIYRRPELNEITDGVVYTIAAGLGFAFFENILYSFGPPEVLVVRGLTAVPLHAISAGILGYYVGVSKFAERPLFGRGLLYAVLIHGCYDFLLFSDAWTAFLVIPLLLAGFAILLGLYRKALAADRAYGRG